MMVSSNLLPWFKVVYCIEFDAYFVPLHVSNFQALVLLGMDWYCWEKDMVTISFLYFIWFPDLLVHVDGF